MHCNNLDQVPLNKKDWKAWNNLDQVPSNKKDWKACNNLDLTLTRYPQIRKIGKPNHLKVFGSNTFNEPVVVLVIWNQMSFQTYTDILPRSQVHVHIFIFWGPGCSWSFGSWIYNYLCNQCLSPLKLWVQTPFMSRCTRYNIMW